MGGVGRWEGWGGGRGGEVGGVGRWEGWGGGRGGEVGGVGRWEEWEGGLGQRIRMHVCAGMWKNQGQSSDPLPLKL